MNRPMTLSACAGCVTGLLAAACFVAVRPNPTPAGAAPTAPPANTFSAPPADTPLPRTRPTTTTDPAVTASATKAPLAARPVAVSETREHAIGVTKTTGTGFMTGLRVKLRLEGPAAKSCVKVGRLKVTEAVDDLGTDLRDAGQLKWCEQLQDVSRFGMGDAEKSSGPFEYELRLGLPARKAAALKGIKGELQVLAGGEEKTVSVPDVRALAGKLVEDSAVKAAGITFKVLPTGPTEKNMIKAEISGDLDAIKEVRAFAGGGENLVTGKWWSEMGGKHTVSYILTKPVGDEALRLELKLTVGQKNIIVPLELANLPLP